MCAFLAIYYAILRLASLREIFIDFLMTGKCVYKYAKSFECVSLRIIIFILYYIGST